MTTAYALFSRALDFLMRGSIVVLSVTAAVGLATPAFAEISTDAIIFSSVPIAQMVPAMEMYFVPAKGSESAPVQTHFPFLPAARWCALLNRNAHKQITPER